MNRRDLTVVAFKSMALWFAISGLIGVVIACIAGPDRIRSLLARVRREAFGTTLGDDTEAGSSEKV